MCFYFGNGKGQVRLIALWDMFRDNTAVQCMLFAKVFQVFYAYIFCIQHTVLVCYSKHMGSSLASLPYRQQVIYYLLKIHIHINLCCAALCTAILSLSVHSGTLVKQLDQYFRLNHRRGLCLRCLWMLYVPLLYCGSSVKPAMASSLTA